LLLVGEGTLFLLLNWLFSHVAVDRIIVLGALNLLVFLRGLLLLFFLLGDILLIMGHLHIFLDGLLRGLLVLLRHLLRLRLLLDLFFLM
jgi:hypothetical protein